MGKSSRGNRAMLRTKNRAMPQIWPEGVFCLIGGNLNSVLSREIRERKISNIHCILEPWDIQGGWFSKIGIDWRKLPQAKGLASWFRMSLNEYWTLVAHNKNKDVPTTIRQQGGIAIFLQGKNYDSMLCIAPATSGTLGDGTHGYCKQILVIGQGW